VAVGGLGRRELAPGSDLDLVLVHRGRRHVRAVAERVWYPIWDAGLGLDHSVRTVKEALAVAADDLKAALGLLDARLVAGDPALAQDLAARALEQWCRHPTRNLRALGEAVAERHRQFGEVAFLLEPELKEGRGGLRDVVALAAAARATPVVAGDGAAVAAAYDVLLAVRVALHLRTGRRGDRLLLQEQDAVGADLGYADADDLMAAVAGAARTVAWASDDGWRRVASVLSGPAGRTATMDRPLGAGLALRDGEVVVTAVHDATGDPSVVLRAAAAAAEIGAPLGRATLTRLAADVRPLPDPWPAPARQALAALLGTGSRAITVLEALDQYGLLVRLLPEWEAVRSRPQRNAYHRFTVDRHLCEAAANAAALTRRVARPDLLLVGALLHDIGKGFTAGPGALAADHSDAGMIVVQQVAARMGFPAADVATLVAMVRHHLLLADVATRRDLDDPATVELVAAAVGDRDTLDLLAALTEADGLATGASAWGSWKAGLVEDLVARTARRLAGHRAPEPDGLPRPVHRALMLAGRLSVVPDGSQVTVVAPDRPGLFCRVAGTLAVHNLDVLAASAASENGMAVEVFEVEPAFGTPPNWARFADDVERALADRLSLETRLAEQARAYAGRRRPDAARPAEARVLFDEDASASATVVEVRAPDGVGVLYRITRALAECGLDVRTAKVTTLGHEVVDAFYVTDAAGEKLAGRRWQAAVEAALLEALAAG